MKTVFRNSLAIAVAVFGAQAVNSQQYQQPMPQQFPQQYQQQPYPQQFQQPMPSFQGGGQLPITPKNSYGNGAYYQGNAVFDVRPADRTVRDVLTRWSLQTGWVHKPEHWAVDRDLPIAGGADASTFGYEFKEAVRRLLASSELTDKPVQPCFYSNHVVRVVGRAELCDKNNQQ